MSVGSLRLLDFVLFFCVVIDSGRMRLLFLRQIVNDFRKFNELLSMHFLLRRAVLIFSEEFFSSLLKFREPLVSQFLVPILVELPPSQVLV